MPLLKANEPMPERPVVIGYYGDPGTRKTSIAHTAENPLLIDFDRGVARSHGRKDVIIVDNWDEVLQYEQQGLYKQYKTIIIDTAKAALDDFLMSYVVKQDYKMQKNKLQAYGAIGDAFKLFLNNRRMDGCDVVLIAHTKKDEDRKMLIPDVTGQSYQLMLRVSDMIGFTSVKNGAATIQWNPTDETVGKNTANLAEMPVPDKNDPAFKTFLTDIIAQVKKSLVEMTEEQRKAIEQSEQYQEKIAADHTPESLTKLLHEINELPDHLKIPLKKLVSGRAKDLGFVANTQTKAFEKSAPAKEEKTESKEAEVKATDAQEKEPPASTTFDDRCKMMADAGMALEADQAVLGSIVISYEEMAELDEVKFKNFLTTVQNAAKKREPRGRKAQVA